MTERRTDEIMADHEAAVRAAGFDPATVEDWPDVVRQICAERADALAENARLKEEAENVRGNLTLGLGPDAPEEAGGSLVNLAFTVGVMLVGFRADNDRLRAALERIERWEMPATGKKTADGRPMSYSFCYGSNGERDYVRRVAREALEPAEPLPGKDAPPVTPEGA